MEIENLLGGGILVVVSGATKKISV